MPLDYRRFNAPENSRSYKSYIKSQLKSTEEEYKELFNDKGLRKDGRAMDEARSLFGRTEMISQAKGSACIEMDRTKVVCSVYEPREVPHLNEFSELGQLFIEVKFAPFSCPNKRRLCVPDAEEMALSADLKKALEPAVCRRLFPNNQVDIFVYILEHDGACLAAAITAAGLALADAVIPMYDIITACSAVIIGDDIFIDPTEAEESLALKEHSEGTNHGIVTLSALHTLKQISNICLTGSVDATCITKIMDALEKECAKMVPNMKKNLASNVARNLEFKQMADEETEKWEELFSARLVEMKKLIKS